MQVVVWGSEASRAAALADGFQAAASREDFFERADVLSLHLRLLDATRGIVTAADLARMKPDALFVNTSRAELVEEGALEEALKRGRPGYAALDVFTSEPLPADAPILKIPTVLATPHLGYVEQDSYELYFRTAFENVVNFANGNPTNILNPEVFKS
jgi:D-3-phosphoglycerate dehydrogenase